VPIFSRRSSHSGADDADETDFDDSESAFWQRRQVKLAGAALVIGGVVVGAWFAVEGYFAKSNLEQARSSAQEVKEALLDGDTERAERAAERARDHAKSAQSAAHSLPWNVAAAVPWLGSPLKTTQQITDVVSGLAADVLHPVARVGTVLSPDRLLDPGHLDVSLLREKQPELSSLADRAANLNNAAGTIAPSAYIDAVGDARSALQKQTADLASMLETASLAARLAPSMMGADGPRDYFMAFQTNAEARGTGGLLGGFGILHFNNGEFDVEDLGKNTELAGASADLKLDPDFEEQYGYANPTTDFRNSNLSSHFPYAAEIWRSMWAQQSGMNVDGVVAIDPVALSYILGAVGPVTMPDGEKVTKDNVVELTESTAYVRFPTDQAARKNYLQDIANAVVRKMTGRVDSPRKLLDALGKAAGERRLSVWSAWPDDQKLLEETPLAHTIPDDPAPYAEIVINNLGGNKLDYYLEREIEYAADGCTGDTRMSTVTVRLKNTLPEGANLPDYVTGAAGLRADVPIRLQPGTMLTSVRLLATKDATLVGALANGQRTPVFTSTERGHPGFEMQVAIPPGQSGEIVFRLSEPKAPGAPRVPVQPLIDNPAPVVTVPECRA
jgi:hypothetical protein